MGKAIEKVKRRMIYRRGAYAPGRYVRFEEMTDPRIVDLSNETGVEVAEIVRIAVDDLLDNKELVKALKALVKTKAPKVIAGATAKADPHYIPIDDLMPA
jgi:phosphoribosylpyrophosphate synthetase